MPIKNLTDKGAALPKILDIRKGGKKTDAAKPGPDLDHFRAVGDTETLRAFAENFGDKPQAIEFISPYSTVAETFEAWREEYSAGGLKHRCDGETTVIRQLPNGTYTNVPMACPGNCKQTGRLHIIIPALKRLGIAIVHTTSTWDIISLTQQLTMYESLRGSLRGIPFILRRVKREISTPSGKDGKRARREKWLLAIEPLPKWVEKQLEAMERAALPSINEPLMLAAGINVPDLDDENDDEAEALCSPDTAHAIEKLWPSVGMASKGQLMSIEAFLHSRQQPDSLRLCAQEYAEKLLAWLQERAIEKQKTQTKVESRPEVQAMNYICGNELAEKILNLQDRFIQLGGSQADLDAEWEAHAGAVSLETCDTSTAEGWLDLMGQLVSSYESRS